MTKPTGRPKGRPKTKEYVTLMARVPQELADRVQHYARVHQQPISVVLRDGVELLLEEDRYRPFLSDRNTVPAIVSDKNTTARSVSDTIPALLSAPTVGSAYIMSDTKEDDRTPEGSTFPPTIVSDGKREGSGSVARERLPAFVSDTKKARIDRPPAPPTPDMVSDSKAEARAGLPQPPPGVPPFDTAKYTLGKLCPRHHEHGHTGQSLLRMTNRHCLACDREKFHERKLAQRQAQRA